ncbi:sensor histidine kinase [Atopobium fossor]|uniref:sensor histidine kinase n=1 Tax=Atopobium fossor TaxID=39487 RepID=UPI0004247076|nr:ATP-binding protein [Atopobium fossor]
MRTIREKSVAHNIAMSIALVVSVIVLIAAVVLSFATYSFIDSQTDAEVLMRTEALAAAVNGSDGDDVAVIKDQLKITPAYVRVTFIQHDGTVVYDSLAPASTLTNHANRPEVKHALVTGQGSSMRRSDTLGEETIYRAVLLDNDMVLRVGIAQSNIWGVFLRTLPFLVVMLIAAIIASIIAGRLVARSFVRKLDGINLDHPSTTQAPKELRPLLGRIEEQQIRLSEKDADRRRFTSNASHELKTPLTVISGYAELIAGGLALPEDVPHFARLIHDETGRMREIVDDLLALSHLEDSSVLSVDFSEVVSLARIANETAGRVSVEAQRRNVKLVVDISDDDVCNSAVTIKGNARLISELVLNLIENGVRYNVEGGSVTVCAYTNDKQQACLRVADTGIGIPPELHEKVFERFYRVDKSSSRDTGGTGLGLAIVKHIAQLHSAQIVVDTNVPQGTVFEVRFPI